MKKKELLPEESIFSGAAGFFNSLAKGHDAPLCNYSRLKPIVLRELGMQKQTKPTSFECLSVEELRSMLSDAALPSSQEQITVMNEAISRLEDSVDFFMFLERNRDVRVFSESWSREHERIFLKAWLDKCSSDEEINAIWKNVAGEQCSRYAEFMILARYARYINS